MDTGRQKNVVIDVSSTPPLDQTIEVLLIALLAFMPLAFGAVQPWSEEVVIILVAAISFCFWLKQIIHKETHLIWSWAYIPPLIFTLIAVFQLIPLPVSIVRLVSPETVRLRAELLNDLPSSTEAMKWMPISLYSHATIHDLRLIIAVTLIFIVVLNIYREPKAIKRLLYAVSIIGGLIVLIAFIQDIAGNGKIYWLISTERGTANGGPFVNHSHYGQFVNLSIGAAFSLGAIIIYEAFRNRQITPLSVTEYLGSRNALSIWLIVGMVILSIATIFISLTRGGVISMLLAGGITVLILASKRHLKGQGWFMVLIGLGALFCVLYAGFDAVHNRMSSLRDISEYEGRLHILKNVSQIFSAFPVLGIGLGTHAYVYPMFDNPSSPDLAWHAENEYAQVAEETGIIGFIAIVCFASIVWFKYVRSLNSHSSLSAASFGLGFGLLAIMFHSLSDFGQHIPANAVLMAVLCALLISITTTDKSSKSLFTSPKVNKWFPIVILILSSFIWIWAIWGINRARAADAHWQRARVMEETLMKKDWAGNDTEYTELISNAATAANLEPGNIKYRHWLNVYRWRSINRVQNSILNSESAIPEVIIQLSERIVDEFHKAQLLCPTYGPTYCVVGQIEQFILNKPEGKRHIEKGYRLAPYDPTVCFVAGQLQASDGQLEASYTKLKQAVRLDGAFFEDAADVYLKQVKQPELAVALAGDDIWRLSHVVNRLTDQGGHEELINKVSDRLSKILEEKCSKPDAPAWALATMARLCQRENRKNDAIEYYRSALVLEYAQVEWRLNLAKLLTEMNQINNAVHEAEICLRLHPGMQGAQALLEKLSGMSAAITDRNATSTSQ